MGNMTTLQILQGVHDWVLDKIDEETANFITKTVNDLVNYYTKSETYTKVEVQQIVDAIKQFTYEVVQVLPTASASTMNKIYLVPAPKSEDKNVKEEYITIQDGSTYSWEMLGTTSIDLSNYYTKGQTDSAISSALSSALASYTTTADLTTLLAQKQDVIQDLATIRSGASAGSTAVQPSTLNNAVKNVVAESGVYDVSANNDNTKFESLGALLSSANLNTLIPTDIRKGGMSVKFVQSSDNSYVQFRYMNPDAATAATFTNVANWQGIDESPKLDSQNIPDSNGVFRMIHDATTEFIDKASLANSWGNGNYTSYATFNLDASGHNGTWHLLKKSAQASAIRMNLSSLQNGKIYKLSFDVSYNSDAVLARLSCSASSIAAAYYVTDYYSKKAIYVKNGHVEINIQKTSDWAYLYITYGGIDTLTYPLDVTISNFALFELKDIKSTVINIKKIIGGAGNRYDRSAVLIKTLTLWYNDNRTENITFADAEPITISSNSNVYVLLRKTDGVYSIVTETSASNISSTDVILLTFYSESNTQQRGVSRGYLMEEYYANLDNKVYYFIYNRASDPALYDVDSRTLYIYRLYIQREGIMKYITVNSSFTFDSEHLMLVYDTINNTVTFGSADLGYEILLGLSQTNLKFTRGLLLSQVSSYITSTTTENLSQIYVNNNPLVDALTDDKSIPVTETQNFNHYYINVEGSLIYVSSTSKKYVRKYTVESGKTYAIRTWRNSAESAGYALYNGDSVVSVGNIGNSLSNLLWTVLTIPEGVDTLYVAGYNSLGGLPYCYILYNKTIYPLLTHDIIRSTTGEFSTNSDFANGSSYSTPRFIKTRKNISVASNVTGNLYVLCYDKNMNYIDSIYNSEIPVNIALPIEVLAKTEYIKLCFYGDSIPVLKVVGDFDDDWDTFNPRPVNVRSGGASSAYFPEGYRRISVLVNVTNPTCCDAERYVASYEDGGETVEVEGNLTEVSELPAEGAAGIIYHYNSTFYMWINSSFVEVTLVHAMAGDTQQLLPDYGMIAIPKQYSNTGEPTRLIIYCHGAAVNYADSVTGFNAQDLEPDYWLAEGYAVMDIEGNPFNDSDEHMSMPQAMDSYVAAYKWAIEHYNLKRDGVFLGGRSMGGGMTISLLRKECPIPLISACPNVPAPAMPFAANAVRKTFWAEHCGLVLPAGFSFQEGLIEAEKPIFLDNWDKWIKYIAVFSMISDLPISDNDKEEMIDKIWLGNTDGRNDYLKTFRGYSKVPVKFFAINQDPSCLEWAKICYRMLINSGQITELRILDSFKDYSGTGTSAHHADTQDPALRTSITTRYGEVMTNVPVVYIEMLQFWRRYEQGN